MDYLVLYLFLLCMEDIILALISIVLMDISAELRELREVMRARM